MKYPSKENVTGLAKQATMQWKADHVVYFNGKQWKYTLANGKIKGEVISYEKLKREIGKLDKETDEPIKSKKIKAVHDMPDAES